MTTTKTRISTLASILGLGALLVFTGCVKSHDKRAKLGDLADQTKRYAITPDVLSDKAGEPVQVLGGMYQTETDYLGCEQAPKGAEVGTLTSNDKVVVTFSGKTMACVKPSSLKALKERPQVTIKGKLLPTPYTVQTRKVIRKSGRTAALEGMTSEEGTGIRLLDIVEFTTNSPILNAIADRIELRAIPGKEYQVYHKISTGFIYIMLVTPKDMMSHIDFPISDNLGNGTYAVPIAWGDIELLKQELGRNGDNEKTNIIEYNKVLDIDHATHISVNLRGIDAIDMRSYFLVEDLYPADYFTKGQWYFSESVVDTRPGSEGFIGTTTGAFDTSFRSATKIQFTRRNTGLIACNVSIDQRYADDYDCEKSDSVLTIPGAGITYGIETSGTDETRIRLYDVLASKAPYFKILLSDTSSVRKSIDEFFSIIRDTNADQVINIKFHKNKFSFVVQRGTNGRRIMYSFLRTDGRTPYAERRHYKDDRQDKFGYFVQSVSKIRSSDTVAREEDLEKDYLVQRHNPTKDIVFHFSTLTPDYKKGEDPYGLEIDYREIGRNSIEYWNKAYERAGAPNRVVLGKEDAPFGDISYNTMNLIDSERGSNLLGVGPSLVDPYSGEVINANANVYIAPFREIIAGQVRNYIKAKTGLLDDASKQLPRSARDNSTLLGDMASSTLGIADVLSSIVPDHVMKMVANFYHHGVGSFTNRDINVDEFASNGSNITDLYKLTNFNSENSMVQNLVRMSKRVPELVFLADRGDITFNVRSRKDLLNLQQAFEAQRPTFFRSYFMSDMAAAEDYNTMTAQIESECGEVLKLVNDVNERARAEEAPARLTTGEELPALRHCMTQIIPGKFQATLIHEIGHTLGLRHNFYASADKENFFNKEEVKDLYGLDIPEHELPRSSSVMDYVRTEQDRLTYPGHYDIAAIRYGYGNAVEVKSSAKRPNTKNGKYVVLAKGDANDDFGSILDELNGQELTPFAYCTDVEASLEIDPMCARHDFGTNPQMIVEDSINSFWESFTLYNFRYDRIGAGVTGPFRRAARMDKLKRVYTEWRVHLANYLGKTDSTGNQYLQRYTPEAYAELLTTLKADPNFKGKDYLAVRDQIFDFVLEVAFFPNKYCLVSTPVGFKAYEFDRLRDELKNQLPKGTKIASCEATAMQDLIKSKGFEYILEAGLPVDNMWHAVNPQDTFEEDVNFRSFRAPIDVVGSFLDRYFASTFLGGRNAGYTGLLEKMFPNMMDEPDLYLKFEQKMLERLTQGANLKEIFSRANGISIPENVNLTLPNYSSESALLKALWLSLEQGIRNPFANNSEKLSKYTRAITTDGDQIKDAQENGGFVMPLTDGSALIVRQEATVAFSLVQAMIAAYQANQGANQQLPTAEQLAGSLVEPVNQLAAILEAQTPETLTAEKYLQFSKTFLGFFAQVDPYQQAMLQQIYINDLLMYLVVLREADTAIEQAKAAGQEPPAGAVKHISDTLAKWNAMGMVAAAAEVQAQIDPNRQQYNITVPTAVTLPATYVAKSQETATVIMTAAAQEQQQKQAVIALHGDEFSAQFDILRSILIYDFSEVNQDIGIRFAEILGDVRADSYDNLMKHSRSDIRDFAKRHLNPKLIAEKELGVEFPFDKVESIKKF